LIDWKQSSAVEKFPYPVRNKNMCHTSLKANSQRHNRCQEDTTERGDMYGCDQCVERYEDWDCSYIGGEVMKTFADTSRV